MKKKEKRSIIITIIVIILLIGGVFAYEKYQSAEGEYAGFANCLTEKGVKMYGAYWCPHCNDQKKAFWKDAKNIPYIECDLNGKQNPVCEEAGITGYPTWKFEDSIVRDFLGTFEGAKYAWAYGNDGKISGFLPLEIISNISGCPLK